MRYFILVFFSFLSISGYTQNHKPPFSIVYQSGYIDLHDPIDIKCIKMPKGYHSVSQYEIIVTDEVAFVHHFNSAKERTEKYPGTKFGHGNIFTDFKNKIEYHQVYANQMDRRRYLIEKSFSAFQFDMYKDSIQVLGYTCYKAILQKDNYFTTIVWYTPALPYAVSNSGFTGLPGAVLAFERLSNTMRFVSIAKSIEQETRSVKKPTRGIPVTEKEYSELLKNIATPNSVTNQ
jgi:GLPGLI family protein